MASGARECGRAPSTATRREQRCVLTNSAGDLKRRTSPREVVTFEPALDAGGIRFPGASEVRAAGSGNSTSHFPS
eukprot:scaffold1785_cov95-Isochrysis_galbana.AAC.4